MSRLQERVGSLQAEVAALRAKLVAAEAAAEDARDASASSAELLAKISQVRAEAAAELSRGREEARASGAAEAERRLFVEIEAMKVQHGEAAERAASDLKALAGSAAAREQAAKQQAAALESQLAALGRKLAEQLDQARAEAEGLTRQHAAALGEAKAGHGREIASLKRAAEEERAAAVGRLSEAEQGRSAALAEAAEAKATSEATSRRAAQEVREAEAAKAAAEQRLREMKELIEEAKVVDKRNEVLDAQVGVELERRKKLHEFVEDLKGRIRVYVRVRTMSPSEEAKGCGVAYSRNHDTSVTYFQHEKQGEEAAKSFDFDKVTQKNSIFFVHLHLVFSVSALLADRSAPLGLAIHSQP